MPKSQDLDISPEAVDIQEPVLPPELRTKPDSNGLYSVLIGTLQPWPQNVLGWNKEYRYFESCL